MAWRLSKNCLGKQHAFSDIYKTYRARYYDTNIGLINFVGRDKHGWTKKIKTIYALQINEAVKYKAHQVLRPIAMVLISKALKLSLNRFYKSYIGSENGQ